MLCAMWLLYVTLKGKGKLCVYVVRYLVSVFVCPMLLGVALPKEYTCHIAIAKYKERKAIGLAEVCDLCIAFRNATPM